jgi:hypothetical protein
VSIIYSITSLSRSDESCPFLIGEIDFRIDKRLRLIFFVSTSRTESEFVLCIDTDVDLEAVISATSQRGGAVTLKCQEYY